MKLPDWLKLSNCICKTAEVRDSARDPHVCGSAGHFLLIGVALSPIIAFTLVRLVLWVMFK